MCFGFGGWITRSGEIVFGLPNRFGNCSHGDAMNEWYTRHRKQLGHVPDLENDWASFEFPEWTRRSFHWDFEQDWIEPWYKDKVMETFKKVRKIYKKFYPYLVLYRNSISMEKELSRRLGEELCFAYDRMVDEMKQVEGCAYDIPYASHDVEGDDGTDAWKRITVGKW